MNWLYRVSENWGSMSRMEGALTLRPLWIILADGGVLNKTYFISLQGISVKCAAVFGIYIYTFRIPLPFIFVWQSSPAVWYHFDPKQKIYSCCNTRCILDSVKKHSSMVLTIYSSCSSALLWGDSKTHSCFFVYTSLPKPFSRLWPFWSVLTDRPLMIFLKHLLLRSTKHSIIPKISAGCSTSVFE